MRFTDKIAVVTGASRGIGRSIAERLLSEGASVVISGRNKEKGQQALDEMNAGDRAMFIQGDATSREDVESTVDAAVERYGRLDILVNNAGGGDGFAPLADTSDEVMHAVLDLNFWSMFWATRRALATMVPQASGRIVNISSLEGKVGRPVIGPYVAAKHAINGITKSLAREVGELGITVNAVCPGLVLTDVILDSGRRTAEAAGVTFEDFVGSFAKESAMNRVTEAVEVAALVAFLASDEASGITGTLMSVDCGTAPY